MKTPTVSVLIPTYNYARYLPEAIDSVLAQDFDDFELIIADDASSDNTVEVCEAYARQDSRIRFFRHEQNLGMVENWNWCVEHACGEYLKPMLADDRFASREALGKMVSVLDGNADVFLVVSARRLINKDSESIGILAPLGVKDHVFAGDEVIRKCILRGANLIGEPTAAMFRSRDAQRGFDPSFRQLVDLEMWFYLLENGSLSYLAAPLCCFRRHPTQQTEINKVAGLPDGEFLRLMTKYGSKYINKRSVFKWIYIEKIKHADDIGLDVLKQKLTASEYIWFYFEYRLTRPFINFHRSAQKRIHRLLLGYKGV